MNVLKNKIFAVVSVFLILSGCGSKKINETDIVGEWYSESIGGSFCFEEDHKLKLKVDLKDTMYMDENNVMHITGSDDDYSEYCTFDGKTYSFNINGIDMITMSRDNESDSAYGEYILESGVFYDEISSEYGDLSDRYSIYVDEDSFDARIRICEYSINKDILTFSGDDLSFFSESEGQESSFKISLEGDILKLVDEEGMELLFSREN